MRVRETCERWGRSGTGGVDGADEVDSDAGHFFVSLDRTSEEREWFFG